jgi:hypothetical protein
MRVSLRSLVPRPKAFTFEWENKGRMGVGWGSGGIGREQGWLCECQGLGVLEDALAGLGWGSSRS